MTNYRPCLTSSSSTSPSLLSAKAFLHHSGHVGHRPHQPLGELAIRLVEVLGHGTVEAQEVLKGLHRYFRTRDRQPRLYSIVDEAEIKEWITHGLRSCRSLFIVNLNAFPACVPFRHLLLRLTATTPRDVCRALLSGPKPAWSRRKCSASLNVFFAALEKDHWSASDTSWQNFAKLSEAVCAPHKAQARHQRSTARRRTSGT